MHNLECYTVPLTKGVWNVPCILVAKTADKVSLRVDTGACSTVISKYDLDKLDYDKSGRTATFFAINDTPILAYKVILKQFTIGSLDLGSQVIWIVEDVDNFTSVLGTDILRKVCFHKDSSNDMLHFEKSELTLESAAEAMLRQLCAEFGLDYSKALPLLPDSWREQSKNDLCACLFVIADRIRK